MEVRLYWKSFRSHLSNHRGCKMKNMKMKKCVRR